MTSTSPLPCATLPLLVPHPQFSQNHLVAVTWSNRLLLVDTRTTQILFSFDADLLPSDRLNQKLKSVKGSMAAAAAKLKSKKTGGAAAAAEETPTVVAVVEQEHEDEEKRQRENAEAALVESSISCIKFYAGRPGSDVQFMGVGSDNKKVYLFGSSNAADSGWTLIGSASLKKKIGCIAFASKPASNEDGTAVEVEFIYGDKFGDAYIMNATQCWNIHKHNSGVVHHDEEPTVRFGALSTLMDMATSHDERFIATADRDEKIRISHYPDVYDIHNYCLGHTELVTSIHFIKQQDGKEVLVSGSGDGTLRVWDFANTDGESLLFTLASSQQEDAIDNGDRQQQQQQRITQSIDSCRIGNDTYLAIVFEKATSVSLFQYVESDHSLKFVEQVNCGSQIVSARFATQHDDGSTLLWVLRTEPSNNHIALFEVREQSGHAFCSPSSEKSGIPVEELNKHIAFKLTTIDYFSSMKKARGAQPSDEKVEAVVVNANSMDVDQQEQPQQDQQDSSVERESKRQRLE